MYRPSEDDLIPCTGGAHSDEPMQRPDHKSKKHPRPRRNEKVGGGHFVFRRGGRTGRIKTGAIMAGKMPFEHPSLESARAEAERLHLDGFLLKPITRSMLLDTLMNVVGAPAAETAPASATPRTWGRSTSC